NKEIADHLGITEQAVKEHVSALLRNLGVRNRAGLAEAATTHRITGTFDADPEWLRFLFRDAPMYIAVLSGPEHRFVVMNDAFRAPIPVADVMGWTYAEAFPERSAAIALLDDAFQSGKPVVISAMKRPFVRQPNGTVEEGYLAAVIQPLPGPDGAT